MRNLTESGSGKRVRHVLFKKIGEALIIKDIL